MSNPSQSTPRRIADVEILGPGSETISAYRERIGSAQSDQELLSQAIQYRAFRGLDYQELLELLDVAEAHYLNVRLGIGRDPEGA